MIHTVEGKPDAAHRELLLQGLLKFEAREERKSKPGGHHFAHCGRRFFPAF